MIARTQLAILDFNDGMDNNEQATKNDGSLIYKQVFSRVTQSWVVNKVMKKRCREYLEPMLQATIDNVFVSEIKDSLPNIGELPKNIANKEKPEMEEAIKNIRTRFSS